MNSKFLSLNINDFLKGLIVTVGSAAITVIQTSLSAGSFTIDWKLLATVSISAGIAYLGKNLFQNESGSLGK
jgi:hypothetical protein